MNKNKVMTTLSLALLLIILIGATYAYFIAQQGGTTSRNVTVTSSTTDLLTFEIEDDIEINANMMNFARGAGNVSGSTTATATLRANNYTNEASEKYNLYIDITDNPFVYSNGNDVNTEDYYYRLAIDLTHDTWWTIDNVNTDYDDYTWPEIGNFTFSDIFDDIIYSESECINHKNNYTNYNSNEHIYANDNYQCVEKHAQTIFNSIDIDSDDFLNLLDTLRINSCFTTINNVSMCLGDLDFYVDDLFSNFVNLGYITGNYNDGYRTVVDNFQTVYDYAGALKSFENTNYISGNTYVDYEYYGEWGNNYEDINGGYDYPDFYKKNGSFEIVYNPDLNNQMLPVYESTPFYAGLINKEDYMLLNQLGWTRTYVNGPGLHRTILEHTSDVDIAELFADAGYLERVPITERVGIPELLLQVTPPNGVTLSSIPGLEYVTVEDGLGNEISGYDITGKEGLIKIADKLPITVTTSNQSGITEQEWTIRIVLVNLDQNQNLNTGKEVRATITMSKEPYSFTGYAYRNNTFYVTDNSSILPNESVYCPVDEENDYNGCDDDWYYLTLDECLDGIEEGYTCEEYSTIYCEVSDSENSCTDYYYRPFFLSSLSSCEDNIQLGITEGWWEDGEYECIQYGVSDINLIPIGDYVTSLNEVLNLEYNVYVAIGDNYNSFEAGDYFYSNEDECLDHSFVQANNYTCEEAVLLRDPFYIKHYVESDIIQNTQVCLYYNNAEFCMEDGYWDTDEETTVDKLQTDVESVLGEADECNVIDSYVECIYGNYRISVSENGIGVNNITWNSNYCEIYDNYAGCNYS